MTKKKTKPTIKDQARLTVDDAIDSLRPVDVLDNIDIETLDWKPSFKAKQAEAPATKAKKAQEYSDYLQEKIEARRKRQQQERERMLANREAITSTTYKHPSMYDDDSPAAKVHAKHPDLKVKLVSTKRAEEWWINESRRNIAAFMFFVWGLKAAPHHLMWFRQMLDPSEDKTIIIGPRGSAKSTAALVFMSWYMGHFPHLANVLISVTLKQAQDRLEAVRDMVEHNERYKKVFPNVAIDKKRPNNKTTLNIKRTDIPYGTWRSIVARNSDPKSPSLFASGVGGSQVIGSRCTGVLLLDDLMDERNIATIELRDKLWSWVSTTLMPILTGRARVIHITTRWHTDDLVSRQLATGEWTHTYTRALTRDPRGRPVSYWPEVFPLKRLVSIHKAIGSPIFKLMYLCIPTALTGTLFDIDMLRQPLPDPLPHFKYLIVSVDPALGGSEQADDTVIATIGIPETMDAMYVLSLTAGNWKPERTAANISKAWATAYQKYGMEPYLILEAVGAMELFGTLLQGIGVVNMKRVLTEKTGNLDKYSRALPLAAIGEIGGLFFNTADKLYNRMVSQLLEFTGKKGEADDFVDALSQVAKRIRGSVRSMYQGATVKKYKIPGAT